MLGRLKESADNDEGAKKQAEMAKKPIGPVGFWVIRTAENIQSGEKSTNEFGPYRTNKEAGMKQREDEEARGESGYEYTSY